MAPLSKNRIAFGPASRNQSKKPNPKPTRRRPKGRIALFHKADRSLIIKTGQLDLLTTVRYADGCTHRKCGWSSCSIGVVVSSMRLRTRNSRSIVRASARVQCMTSWILRTPSACRPCSVSTGPRCTSAAQRSCSCSGDISQVYNVWQCSRSPMTTASSTQPPVMWGLLFSPTTRQTTHVAMLPRLFILLIEGQAYVLAIFGSYLWGRWVVHPSKAGFATSKAGYVAGLRANMQLYSLILATLAVSAVHEAVEVIGATPLIQH